MQVWPDLEAKHSKNLPNGCTIGVPPAGVELTYAPGGLSLESVHPHVQTMSQTISIQSETYYWCEISAETGDDAVERVLRGRDIEVRLALHVATGHEIQTVPVMTQNLETGETVSAGINIAQFQGGVENQPVDWGIANAAMEALASPQLRTPLHHLRRGDDYMRVGPTLGALSEDAALMEYAKSLEDLVKGETNERDPDYEGKRAEMIDRLTRDLTSRKNDKKKAAKVISTSSSLFELERRTVLIRVQAYSDRLGLGDDWLGQATRLIRVRNTRLAHPGRELDGSVRKSLKGARQMLVEAIFASAHSAENGERIKPPVPAASQPLEPGPTLRWEQARRKIYDINGSVRWE